MSADGCMVANPPANGISVFALTRNLSQDQTQVPVSGDFSKRFFISHQKFVFVFFIISSFLASFRMSGRLTFYKLISLSKLCLFMASSLPAAFLQRAHCRRTLLVVRLTLTCCHHQA